MLMIYAFRQCMCRQYSGLSNLPQRTASCGKLTTGHALVRYPYCVRRHNQLSRTGQRQSWIFIRRRNRLRGWPLLLSSSSDEMRSACASVLLLPALKWPILAHNRAMSHSSKQARAANITLQRRRIHNTFTGTRVIAAMVAAVSLHPLPALPGILVDLAL